MSMSFSERTIPTTNSSSWDARRTTTRRRWIVHLSVVASVLVALCIISIACSIKLFDRVSSARDWSKVKLLEAAVSAKSSNNADVGWGNKETAQPTSCNLDDTLQRWTSRASDLLEVNLPGPLSIPNKSRPFVFFHLRKAGGSSIRSMLKKASIRLGLDYWIACFSVGCGKKKIPSELEKRKDTYGGHLQFSHVVEQLQDAQVLEKEQNKPFECIVSLRPTVSRVVSCWNFRFGKEFGGIMPDFEPADVVSKERWARDLPRMYSRHKEGCNNEFLRVFGNMTDEVTVNTLALKDNATAADRCSVDLQLETVLDRLSQCVITISNRCEDNLKVVAYYIPWFAPFYDCSLHKNVNTKHGSSESLQEGAAGEILYQNQIDEYGYQFGLIVFEEQLRVANALTQQK